MSENGLHKIPTMRTALEAIQELHKPVKVLAGWTRCSCNVKDSMGLSVLWPCTTRRLADQGLGDNLARTTKNGDNK